MFSISETEFRNRCSEFFKKFHAAKREATNSLELPKLINSPVEKKFNYSNVDCKPGCTYCCNLRVSAYVHEVIAIYEFIKSNFSKEQLKELRKKIEKQFNKIKNLSHDDHLKTNVECPLLFDDKCSVYEHRPLSCSGYHSLSVKVCKHSDENPTYVGTEIGGIPLDPDIQIAIQEQRTVVGTVFQHSNEPMVSYELIRALKEVLDNPGLIELWRFNQTPFSKPQSTE